MNKETLKDLKVVLEYILDNEKNHYEESKWNDPKDAKNHIYLYALRVSKTLKAKKKGAL